MSKNLSDEEKATSLVELTYGFFELAKKYVPESIGDNKTYNYINSFFGKNGTYVTMNFNIIVENFAITKTSKNLKKITKK